MAYNDVMNYIHRDTTEENGELWKFRRILGHQGPLTRDHADYKGSKYNVSIEWENGEITYEPLKRIYLRMIRDTCQICQGSQPLKH